MKISAVVFDMDGTLVETNIKFTQIKEELSIPQDQPILEYIEKFFEPKDKEKAYAVVHKYEAIACKNAKEIRDITPFLNALKSHSIPTGILTRNSRIVTDETLKKFKWSFDLILTRDCAKAKPDPEGLILFSKKYDIPISEILYIGDYDFDLDTAKNAGSVSGLILNSKNEYLVKDADIVITNYMDILSLIIH